MMINLKCEIVSKIYIEIPAYILPKKCKYKINQLVIKKYTANLNLSHLRQQRRVRY